MTAITLSTTTDYRSLSVTPVTSLTFTNLATPRVAHATAIFNADQLALAAPGGLGGVNPTAVTGSVGFNHLEVRIGALSEFDLGWMTFTNWAPSDTVTAFGSTGNDTIASASVATLLDGGAGDDKLLGNAFGDTLLGGDGNDHLYGGGQLFGGAGNDTLTVASGAADGGDGIDTFAGVPVNLALGVTVDIHDGGAGRDIGNGLTLIHFERLNMSGTIHNDVVTGANLRDFISGNSGDDRISGLGGNDYLSGGSGNDTLFGGNGADILSGLDGADRFFGGAGADRFVYETMFDSNVGASDVIGDFQQGVDMIDLSHLGLNLRFIKQTDFDPGDAAHAHEVRYEKLATSTLVQFGYSDFDGDHVILQVFLTGAFDLTANDFIL